MTIKALLPYFWLICAVWVGAGNAVFFRLRLRTAVREGALTQDEVNRFALGILGWIGGPCLILGALQFLAGGNAFPYFLLWGSPFREIAVSLIFVQWIIAFIWIWFRGGDRQLARFSTLAGRQKWLWQHPVAFRLLVIVAIVAGVVGMLLHDPANWNFEADGNSPAVRRTSMRNMEAYD